MSEGDAATQAVVGVVQGTAASSPTAPTLPDGAIELARAVVPAGITATTSATITQTAPFTAPLGAVLPFRNSAERNAFAAMQSQMAWLIDESTLNVYDGTAWLSVASGDSGWINASLSGAWVSFDGGTTHAVPRYRKIGKTVRLGGTAKSGAIGTIFTLDANYRPAKFFYALVMANSGALQISVAPSGVVSAVAYIAGGTNAIVSLEGVTFTVN